MKKKRNTRRKKGLRLFGLTARALMLASAALLLVSYLSVLVNPARAWFFTFFGLLYIPLFLLNLFLLLWALRRRSRSLLIPLLALLPSVFFLGNNLRFSGGADADGARTIEILSYNVGRFAPQSGRSGLTSRQACRDSVIAYAKRSGADIICLQEYYDKDVATMRKRLAREFPGYNMELYINSTGHAACGNVTLSRLPVKGKGKFDFENSTNLALYTDIALGDRTVRVYNCHFESYNISPVRIIKSMGRDEALMQETEAKMRRSLALRPKQVEEILNDITSCPVGAVVAGDFNDPPMSYTYYRLKRGRKDSFEQAGRGFGGTYDFFPRLLRIDYILFPSDMDAISHKVEKKVLYSDHYPIKTVLKI